jgi:outer membrane immunogenic protein
MRRFRCAALAAVAVFGFASAGSAADLPVKAPIYKSPVAIPYSWTGFYVGGELGGAWGHEVGSTVFTTAFSTAGSQTPADIDGFLGGLEVGYNYQLNPFWVIGVNADWLWTNTKGSASRAGSIAGVVESGSTSVHWYSTVTGRVGYAMNDWLLYGKGGAAFSSADYNAQASFLGVVVENATNRVNRAGWTVGVGVEKKLQMISPNLTAKLEYDYLDFGTDRILFTFPGFGVNGADTTTHVHVVKAGLGFLFNP